MYSFSALDLHLHHQYLKEITQKQSMLFFSESARPGTSFQCFSGSFIPASQFCDGSIDCSTVYREDEPDRCLSGARSCLQMWAAGYTKSGVYLIKPHPDGKYSVDDTIAIMDKGSSHPAYVCDNVFFNFLQHDDAKK